MTQNLAEIETDGAIRIKVQHRPNRQKFTMALIEPTGETRLSGSKIVIAFCCLNEKGSPDLALVLENTDGMVAVHAVPVSPEEDLERRQFTLKEILESRGFSIVRTTDREGGTILRFSQTRRRKSAR